ncbi:MAG: helix-turn-helix transcriptional regulator [Planctomycetes bacterium]|nr:helix-turn-helix transcriptional regulator [Planctomycetota bacterium]
MMKKEKAAGFLSQARTMRLPLGPDSPISVRISERPKDTRPAYDVHSACEVGVVLSGEYIRIYEGLSRHVTPGQIWICGVWEPHGHQTLKTPTCAMVATFLLEFLWEGEGVDAPWGRLFLNHAPENREIVLTRKEAQMAKRLALELDEECRLRRPHYLAAARLCLKRLLLPLLRKSEMTPVEGSTTDFHRIEQVMAMVRRRLPRQVTVADACRAAGLSRSQFASVFRRTTGVTFGDFVQRARIARVAHNLATTDVKIAAIAKAWGYTDHSHMHRMFKKFFRCTPMDYRKRSVG